MFVLIFFIVILVPVVDLISLVQPRLRLNNLQIIFNASVTPSRNTMNEMSLWHEMKEIMFLMVDGLLFPTGESETKSEKNLWKTQRA